MRPGLACAVGEELDSVSVAQRRHHPGDLAAHAQRLTARGKDLDRRRRGEKRSRHRSRRLHHLLAVVEHDQGTPLREILTDRFRQRPA